MDFVSSYCSDDEMENLTNLEKEAKKNVEDGEWSDDSDILDIVFVKTAGNSQEQAVSTAGNSQEKTVTTASSSQEKTASTVKKSQIPIDDDIECICLDDSDSDIVVSLSPEHSEKNSSSAIKKEISKKIDYLNLESSDTDDEQERIQNDVNNLLSSAAILNDIECGPSKAVPEVDLPITLLSCTGDGLVGKKRPSSPVSLVNILDDNENTTLPVIDISADKSSSQADVSNKKVKSNAPVTAVNVSTVEGPDPRIGMYRKDDRIVAAYKKKGSAYIPSTLSQTITAHEKAISSVSWCAIPHSHLFLTSSLDCTVKIWDIYSANKPIQTLAVPVGVRAAKWSKDGEQILAGGFGKQLHVIDALSGKTHMEYKVHNYVSCITIHPFIEDVILCGTQNAIFGYDLRVDKLLPVRTFLSKCGEVLDMAFLNKNEFVCSTSVVSHDSADRTIMVWDFNSGALMSNQIFLERYTCPSLKITPSGSSFIAQTNGDYIAEFSTEKPYKIKNKRYMGHKVSGFGIECDISPDGQYVASGDAKGDVYFYNSGDTTVVKKLTVKPNVATNRLQWHPVLSSTIAVATWDGQIQIWK